MNTLPDHQVVHCNYVCAYLLSFLRYNDLLVENLHFFHFYRPRSRLQQSQVVFSVTYSTKVGMKSYKSWYDKL